MALKNIRCFYIISIFIILQATNVSTIFVETVPESINEILTDQLDISCTYNGSHGYAQQIVLIKVMMEGKRPIAILREGKMHLGPEMRISDMKVEGHVQKNAKNGYLRVSIMNPKREDAGTYKCMMVYLDGMFQITQEKATVNVTLDELDLTTVVSHLARKISSLKRTVQKQDDIISKQNHTIQGHQNKLDEQQEQDLLKQNPKGEKESSATVLFLQEKIKEQDDELKKQDANAQATQKVIDILQDKVLKLEGTVAQQTNDLQDQKTKLEDQDYSIQQQNQLLYQYQQKHDLQNQEQLNTKDHIDQHNEKDQETVKTLDDLKATTSALTMAMNNQAKRLTLNEQIIRQQNNTLNQCQRQIAIHDKEIKETHEYAKEIQTNSSFMSAFSFGFKSDTTFDVGKTVLFAEPILNIGDDYDPETGVFTAPRDGLYVFHLVATTASGHWAVEIDLNVGKKTVASLHSRDEDHWDQSSISTVVSLHAGDKVKPVVTYKNTGNRLVPNDHYSVFSGYLLN